MGKHWPIAPHCSSYGTTRKCLQMQWLAIVVCGLLWWSVGPNPLKKGGTEGGFLPQAFPIIRETSRRAREKSPLAPLSQRGDRKGPAAAQATRWRSCAGT